MEIPASPRHTATSRPPRSPEAEGSHVQLSSRALAAAAPVAAVGVSLDLVSLHLLRAIARASARGRATDLETLSAEISVRKVDCRAALSTLHRQGYVDVLRMRPTLQGFALGASIRNATLDPVRTLAPAATRAA